MDPSAGHVYRGGNLTLHLNGSDDQTSEGDLNASFRLVGSGSAGLLWEQELSDMVDVAISNDGRWIAVGRDTQYQSQDNGVYVYQRNGSLPHTFYPTNYAVEAVIFSPDNRHIIAATENDMIQVFELVIGGTVLDPQPLRTFRKGDSNRVDKLAVTAGSENIIAITHMFDIFIFQMEDKDSGPTNISDEIPWYSLIKDEISDIAIAADGTAVAISIDTDTLLKVPAPSVRILKLKKNKLIPTNTVFTPSKKVRALDIASQGKSVIAYVRNLTTHKDEVYLFKPELGNVSWGREIPSFHGVSLSGNGKYVVITTDAATDTIELLDGTNGSTIWSHEVWRLQLDDPIAVSTTGSTIAVIYKDLLDYTHRLQLLYNWHPTSFSEPFFDGTGWQTTFRFPMDAPLGHYSFKARFDDGVDTGLWNHTNGTIQVVNNPPIVELSTPARVNQGTRLKATTHDVDGVVVDHRWRSSVDGNLSDQGELDTSDMSPGNQTLYLMVQDNEGAWSTEISASFVINGRPTAWLVEVPTEPVLKGEMVLLRGNGSDDDPDGSIAAHRWRVGPMVHHAMPGEPLELDTRLLSAGNHTLSFQVQDSRGAWSIPTVSWFWVSTPPKAIINSLDVAVFEGETVVTLWGTGTDEGYIKKIQWQSSVDGIFEGPPGVMVMDNLSVGTHMLSFRVQDNAGQWSTWTYHNEPVTVAGAAAEQEPGAIAALKEPRFYLLVLATYLVSTGAWVSTRPYRNRWLAGQVQVHSERLWNLQDRFIALGLELDFPRQRLDRALEPLTKGHYWRAQERLKRLEREVEATFELFGECHGLRRELKELTRYHSRQIRGCCPPRRLERLEYLWMVRRLKEYRDQTRKALKDIHGALAANGHCRGIPPSTMRRRWQGPGSSLHGNGHGLTPLGPKPRNGRRNGGKGGKGRGS